MRRSALMRQRLAAAFIVGSFLLCSPVVMLFDRPVAVFGAPLLYVYLFGVWVLLIAVMAWIVEGGRE